MGRSFMYGVSALGKKGGNHTISLFKNRITASYGAIMLRKNY
ncbi:L-lactate dehydrogenase [Jejuia pallidilutea]|uniref:L-lactate dehydrogenase n=1 Tax=Jejuia pallidilutea TaxID=504487 RepID=A0A090W919_9FLAO|nr:L-lactate dehydrogenase [Jejuia pallidilutea]